MGSDSATTSDFFTRSAAPGARAADAWAPAALPPGQHTLFDAAWFFTTDVEEVRRLRSLHLRSVVQNPCTDQLLTLGEVEELYQSEDWIAQVLIDRLASGELRAIWRPQGEITWQDLAENAWIGAKIALRKNVVEINGALLTNVLVSRAHVSADKIARQRPKPSQSRVDAWVVEFQSKATAAGRPLPKRDLEIMPAAKDAIGATELQVKVAYQKMPAQLKRSRGNRDR